MNLRARLKVMTATAALVATGLTPVAAAQSGEIPAPGPGSAAPGSAAPSSSTLDLLAGSAAPAPARAPEGGARLIVLGDSMTSGTNLPLMVDSRRCPQGMGSWPMRVAEHMKVAGTPDYVNQSCYGGALDTTPAITLADQARAAADLGAFGPRTERVLIQLGFNDEWGTRNVRAVDAARMCWVNLIDGCGMDAVAQGRTQDPAAVTPAAYRERMQQVVEYVKYFAPNATIALVGYPDLRPAQPDAVCMSVLGMPLNNPRGEAFARFTEALQNAQRGAARELGIRFVDLHAATAGHGPCTDQPWIDGIVDFRSNPLGGPMHLSPMGEAIAARAVLDTVNG